jgi:hypothetical protein
VRNYACPSCGAVRSIVRVKKRQFSQFLVRVICCPQCKLRTTFLTFRRSNQAEPSQISRAREDNEKV